MQADTTLQAPGRMTAPQDTTATTEVVPFIPPSNGYYMIAGYTVVGVIYVAYTISLFLRGRAEQR